MSMFYAGRHRAAHTPLSATHRAGAGVLAATALGLGASTMTATQATAAPAAQTAPSSQSATSSTSSFTDVVKRGDRGSVVKKIQQKVGVSADGVFGPQTERAVKSWQSDNGLTADGVVGPKTGSKMGLGGSSGGGSDEGGSNSSVLSTAESLVGTPYVYGGTSTSGFDCSGFTQYVFAKHGKDLPRTAEAQRQAATPVSSPQPGDLVFFGSPAYHLGIYAGDGQIYDAGSTPASVTKRSIWDSNVTYGRV